MARNIPFGDIESCCICSLTVNWRTYAKEQRVRGGFSSKYSTDPVAAVVDFLSFTLDWFPMSSPLAIALLLLFPIIPQHAKIRPSNFVINDDEHLCTSPGNRSPMTRVFFLAAKAVFKLCWPSLTSALRALSGEELETRRWPREPGRCVRYNFRHVVRTKLADLVNKNLITP